MLKMLFVQQNNYTFLQANRPDFHKAVVFLLDLWF